MQALATKVGERLCLFLVLMVGTLVYGQAGVDRIPLTNSDFPISSAVVVPGGYDTIYVSGTIPAVANASAPKGSIESYGDTQTQTVSVLKQIQSTLAKQNMYMADVVMMHVFLVGDRPREARWTLRA